MIVCVCVFLIRDAVNCDDFLKWVGLVGVCSGELVCDL